jgi:isopropylmalate/homocitrate/citramalate synthase
VVFDHFSQPPHPDGSPHFTIVDVTLRDGGFEVSFDWPESAFRSVPLCLAPLGVDFTEIGYIGGVPLEHKIAEPGRGAFITPRRLLDIGHVGTSLAAMIHPTALEEPIDLAGFAQADLRMVRIVYHPNWVKEIVYMARHARDCGLIVTVNLALASRYTTEELVGHACRVARDAAPDVIYIADTCGAMLPRQVAKLVAALAASLEVAVGFHAHNFLSLAYANALAALGAGASYIDCSLLGLGRGGGNLETELILARHRIGPLATGAQIEGLLRCRSELGNVAGRDVRSLVPTACGAANLTPVEESALLDAAERVGLDPSDAALRFLAAGAERATLRMTEPSWADS